MAIKRGEKTRLAEACGVTRQAVHQWFNPKMYQKIGFKTLRNAEKIVQLLNNGFSKKEVAEQIGVSPCAMNRFTLMFTTKTYSLNEKALQKISGIRCGQDIKRAKRSQH